MTETIKFLCALLLTKYSKHHFYNFLVFQSSDRLNEPVQSCDVAADIQTVVSLKGTGQPPSEQLLPDFYAEHVTLGMNRDRRKQVCRI